MVHGISIKKNINPMINEKSGLLELHLFIIMYFRFASVNEMEV